ncbi:Trimeric LpxA-like superfamily [Fagus crenata]
MDPIITNIFDGFFFCPGPISNVKDARSKAIEDVLILSGDHLYRMDYMDFVQNHRQSGADITISSLPMMTVHNNYELPSSMIIFLGFVDSRASDFGLMKIDNKGRILSFSEKPKGEELKAMAVDTTVLGLSKDEAQKKPYIASMGVYVFKKEIHLNLLSNPPSPSQHKRFHAYLFNDYWEDIGTIRSFFEANLALTEHPPRFSFYNAAKPMYTSRRNLPPTKIDNSKDTVMLGADFYETDAEAASLLAEGRVPIGIGENTKIKECIIDKNARIGKNVVIANSEGIQEADRSSEGFYIRSGVTIILKNSVIQDGFVI